MIARITAAALGLVALQGCTTDRLQTALGTPKNPMPIFTKANLTKKEKPTQKDFIEPLYRVLLEASEVKNNNRTLAAVGEDNMRRYLGAGFALSDIYCAGFFSKTDEAYRRRRFGRTLTNDVGTAVSTVLGLAKAGENIVTGVAAAVGLADSAWRNYDDSFVVSPDLSNVQSLVFAAQDNFRATTLDAKADLPGDYGTAQSIILRYSNLCSFLGMKALLDQSAGDQRNKLNADTRALTDKTKVTVTGQMGARDKGKSPNPANVAVQRTEPDFPTPPVTATPPLSVNQSGS